ncbi:MAG: SDR family oxidoreductase [Bacteroidales bacterium]
MEIKGKIAWITGASSGIGQALAEELFRQGATVILSARNSVKLEALKSRFDQTDKSRSHVVPCDVTKPREIQGAVEKIRTLVSRIDILINNAGVSQRSTVLETQMEVYRELMEVNFFGAVEVTKAVLPWMVAGEGGHIVVISSMAGKYGFRMRSGYSAAKHALQGFFETLRAEMNEKNIRVTLICPGRVKTDVSVNSLTGDGQKHGKMDSGQEHGVPVAQCARIIVRAVKRNRKEVFIGGLEVFLLVVKRICPPLYYMIVNRASPT